MRVSGTAGLVAGVALGGVIALGLSGGAMADSSSESTTTQTVVVDGTVQPAPSPSPVLQVAGGDKVAPAPATSKMTEASPAPSVATPAPLAAVPTPAAVRPVEPVTPAPTVTVVQPVASAQPAPVAQAAPVKPVAAVNFQTVNWAATKFWPVQPIISSTPAVDLASLVPTNVPKHPVKAPTPPQPNGALGQLTAELAGVVVPTHVLLGAGAGAATETLICLFLSLMLMTKFVTSFGAQLRRQGYVHAARSDVAGTGLIFATPTLMSYVTAPGQRATHF